jgi:hypothetical protein
VQVPASLAEVTAQTNLSGITFAAGREVVQRILQAQTDYLGKLLRGLDDRKQLSLLDLVSVCIEKYAAKNYSPLGQREMVPFYPFLSQPVVKAGYSAIAHDPAATDSKKVLKSLLARDVPHNMVYRPKSGFRPPIELIFADRQVKDYIQSIVEAHSNPLRNFVYPRVIARLFDDIWRGRPIAKNHLHFLWSYIFGSAWLIQQIKRNHDRLPSVSRTESA